MRRKEKKEIYSKTRVFASRKKCSIYRKSIDWITVRLAESNEKIQILDRIELYVEDRNERINILKGKFYIQYFGLVMGSALKVFHIKDTENNVQVGCVHILQKSEKKNKNI